MANNRETTPVEPTGLPGNRLWRDRNFNIFWFGQTFDAFGDSFAMIVMPLLVLETTGSIAQMGLVTGTIGVGNFISGLVSGLLIDRLDRRRLMIFCDIGRVIFYGFIPLGWWFWGASIGLIYVIAALTAFLTTTFLITYTAVIPNIIDFDQTTDANGRLQTTVALAYVIGPMLAGFASKQFQAAFALGIVSAFYLASALLISLVRIRKVTPIQGETPTRKRGHLQEFLAGGRFLLSHPVLKYVTLLLASFIFFSEATIDLSIFRLKHDLHQNNDAIGIVFAVASLGALVGGLVAPALRRKWGFGLSFLGSLLLQGMAIAAIGLAPNATLLAVLATAFSFGLTIRNVSSMTVRQQVTPDRLMGRVSAALWTIITVLGPIGITLTTALAEKVGVPMMLVVCGIMSVLVAIAGFFTPANTPRPETATILSLVEE